MNSKKTVCIIGAGIGGLISGANLIKKGYRVKIFEKQKKVGGRAFTLDMTDITLKDYKKLISDFNMHIPFSEPSLNEIFEKNMLKDYNLDLGFHVFSGEISEYIKNAISEDKMDTINSRLYVANNGKIDFFVTTFDKIKMVANLLRLFLSGEKTMKDLDKTSITETIKKYGRGKTKDVLELNPRLITTVNNLKKISTGEVFRTQREMKLRGVRYPKNGLGYLFDILVDFIKKNGGELFLNHKVSKINIYQGKVNSVEVKGKSHKCDIVISNTLVQDLFKIADENFFPKKYVNHIKSLDGTGSLCAYYSLKEVDKKLIGKNFVFIERDTGLDGNDVSGMIDFMVTCPDAGISPKNHFIVQSYVICTPDEAKDKKSLKKLRKILDENLKKIIPDYESNLKWAIYPATWHLDGVAKTIDNDKPEIITPIKNLYLVGDCVKAPGIGFNCALNSARILCNDILK